MEIIKFTEDQNLQPVLNKLKNKRKIAQISKSALSIINCEYHDFDIDAYTFRYEHFHSFLASLDDKICDNIIYSFRRMTCCKWNIICYILQTYSSPLNKPVEKFIENNIILK